MIKHLLVAFTLCMSIYGREILPAFTMHTSGLVNDFVIDGDKLYVATDMGSVDIFSLRSRKLIDQILVGGEITAQGKEIEVHVLSVDREDGKTLLVTTSPKGYRNVWLHDGIKLRQIIGPKDKLVVRKARFIDGEHFMFASVGYELMMYTLEDSHTVYKKHIEQSAFSDMVLSEDRSTMATASESGKVVVSDVQSTKVLAEYALNLDNIYKLAYKNGTIITAGQDRQVAVYPKKGKAYTIKSAFLVYAVGLSPSGKLGVYVGNEESDLILFDVQSGQQLAVCKGHKAIPSTISFFSEKGFFSAGYENKIFYWHLE